MGQDEYLKSQGLSDKAGEYQVSLSRCDWASLGQGYHKGICLNKKMMQGKPG